MSVNVKQKNKNPKQQGTVYRDLGQFHEWRGTAGEEGERPGQSQVRDAIAKYRERREAALHLFGTQGKGNEDKLQSNFNKKIKHDSPVVTNNSTSERIKKLQMATLAPVTTAVSHVPSTIARKVPSKSDRVLTSLNMKTVTPTTTTTTGKVTTKSNGGITCLKTKTVTHETTTTATAGVNVNNTVARTTIVREKVTKELASSLSTITPAPIQDNPVLPYGYVPWSSKPKVNYVPWSANKASTSTVVNRGSDVSYPQKDVTPEMEQGDSSDFANKSPIVVKDIDRVDRVFRHLEQEDWGQKSVHLDRPEGEEIGIGIEKPGHKENYNILGRDTVTAKRHISPPQVIDVDKTTESDHPQRSTLNQFTNLSHDAYADGSIVCQNEERITLEMDYDPFSHQESRHKHKPRTEHPRKLKTYLAKKKSRVHRRDVSNDRNRGHSPTVRHDSRHDAEQERINDRNRLEELTKLLKTFIEKSERVYPVKGLKGKQTSDEKDSYLSQSSHVEDINQQKDVNHPGNTDALAGKIWQHSNRNSPFDISGNIEKLVSPGKVSYSEEKETINSGNGESAEDMTEFDRLLKAELDRKKRKDDIKDMLIRAGEESVTAYRESVENRPSSQGGVQNADNYPTSSRDQIHQGQNYTARSSPPISRIHSTPFANLPHDRPAPGSHIGAPIAPHDLPDPGSRMVAPIAPHDMPGPASHMIAPIAPRDMSGPSSHMVPPIAPYIVRPPLLSFPPVVVLRPGLPIVPPRFPLPLQPSPLPISSGNQTIPRLPPPPWYNQTSSGASDAPPSTVRNTNSNSPVVTSTRVTTATSRSNLQQNKSDKPIMTIDLTKSESPPPIKPQPLMEVDLTPHLGRQLPASQQPRNVPSNHPSRHSAERPDNSRKNNEHFVHHQRKVSDIDRMDHPVPLLNTTPTVPPQIIPPPAQPQLILYNNMLIPVQPLSVPVEQSVLTEPFDIPIQEEPHNTQEERGRHNLIVHNPRNVHMAPAQLSSQPQDQLNKPHKRVRRGRGGKVSRTPEERRQLRNEQKNASNMNAPWFDGECYLASKRKKQVIHKMRNRVALQKRQGDLVNAEETMNAIRGVQNAYSNFIRGKKAMYVQERDEKGDVEYICKLTLENIIQTVCCTEKMEEKQARIQKEMERQNKNKMKKTMKRDENMRNRGMIVIDNDEGKRNRNESVVSHPDFSLHNNMNIEGNNSGDDDTDDDDTDDDDDRYGGDGGWSRWRKEIQNEQQASEEKVRPRAGKGIKEQHTIKENIVRTTTGKEGQERSVSKENNARIKQGKGRWEQHASEESRGKSTKGRRERLGSEKNESKATTEKERQGHYASEENTSRTTTGSGRWEQHVSGKNKTRTTTEKERQEQHAGEVEGVTTTKGKRRWDQHASIDTEGRTSTGNKMRQHNNVEENTMRATSGKGRHVKHS